MTLNFECECGFFFSPVTSLDFISDLDLTIAVKGKREKDLLCIFFLN